MRLGILALAVALCMIAWHLSARSQGQVTRGYDDDLRAEMAELKADIEATRAEVKAILVDKLKDREAELQRSLGRVETRSQRVFDKQAAKLAEITAERDALRASIRAANGRWTCEVLRVGCVGVK